jgi:ABC-2 type transport system permease protein
MTAASVAAPRPYTKLTGRPGVPFHRLVKAELRKLTDTRASKWLLFSIIAITVLVVVVAVIVAKPGNLTFTNLIDYAQSPQKILLPVLAILIVTSEWSQRTGLVTFTLSPHRGRVLLAKLVATLTAGAISISSAFAAAALGNLVGKLARDGNGSWSFGPGALRDLLLVQVTGLLQGLAFGMLLLISAAAVVLFYVLPNAWDLLFSSVSGLKDLAPWVDLNTAQQPLYLHQMDGRSWAQFASAAGIWVVLPLVLGAIRVRRSEVKSG